MHFTHKTTFKFTAFVYTVSITVVRYAHHLLQIPRETVDAKITYLQQLIINNKLVRFIPLVVQQIKTIVFMGSIIAKHETVGINLVLLFFVTLNSLFSFKNN